MPTAIPAGGPTRAHPRTLLAAMLLWVAMLGFVHGCGTEDLTFPGQAPPTAVFTGTPEPTETPDPDEEV